MINKISQKYLDKKGKQSTSPKLYHLLLSFISITFIATHIVLIWNNQILGLLGLSLLAWLAIISLVWEKRDQLIFKPLTINTFLGGSLIIWVFWQSFTSTQPEFLYLSPLIFGLAIALSASGFKKIKQYQGELMILFFLGVPKVLITSVINIYPLATTLTAKISTFILWYSGKEAFLDGVTILVPDGGVRVVPSCSGTDVMAYMLALSVICVVKYPLSTKQNMFSSIFAVILGFLVNSIRVAILAILSAQNQELFDYWHEGEGGQVFTIIPVIIFGFIYLSLIKKKLRLKVDNISS